MPLSQSTIDIVKKTAPAVASNGQAIVETFYRDMLTNPDNAEIVKKFPHSHHIPQAESKELDPLVLQKRRTAGRAVHKESGRQQHALLGAVVAYATHIDDLGALTEAVERIAHKHVQFQIPKEMYPTIGVTLLGAVKKVLGDAATEEVLAAWSEAYFFLANLFIEIEGKMYDELAEAEGGWRGWRKFAVDRIEPDPLERLDVKHIYLKPEDGGPLLRYDAGQSITLRFIDELPEHEGPFGLKGCREEIRNYTLSRAFEADPSCYRITVRGEAGHGGPNGIVSTYLTNMLKPGNVLRIAPPRGVHTLKKAPPSGEPIVLIGGGVGMTSVFAMFDEATRDSAQQRDIVFVHIVRDRDHRLMETEIRSVMQRAARSKAVFVHTHPLPGEEKGKDYDLSGHIDSGQLAEYVSLDLGRAQWHFTGPVGFMEAWKDDILSAGTEQEVFYEVFGPM